MVLEEEEEEEEKDKEEGTIHAYSLRNPEKSPGGFFICSPEYLEFLEHYFSLALVCPKDPEKSATLFPFSPVGFIKSLSFFTRSV